ncbi:MAG: FAD-dependent monooxygenase [Polyangiales bacterium]
MVQRTPVLIVGGGGAGVTASMLLATYGIESLLISAFPTTSVLPKAHVLQQRAMEVFHDVGVADETYAKSTPAAQMSHTAWYLDVFDADDAGRRIRKMECWDGGYTDPAWIAASPCRQANLPQIRLEPLLRARAEALNPGRVKFHHELIALERDADGVLATIRDKDGNAEYQLRADYLLGCDGGRTVGRLVGVELAGQRDIMRSVTVHMTGDLSNWLRDDDVLIRWILHTSGEGFSVLVPMGPDHWGPKSEEWVFHMNYPPALESLFDTDEEAVAVMRRRLGIPDFTPKQVHLVTRWHLEGLVAPTTRVGRVLLVGDAAHRHPPTGGLGLNSAVHDAYNLCWKLAHVLQGKAEDALLDTYHAERFPSFARDVQRSVENALNHVQIAAALGVTTSNTPEESRRNVRQFWQEGPEGDARRATVMPYLAAQSMEFKEHNVEYGFRARSAAVILDGSSEPVNVDDVRIYQPDTRPGSPLPHAWVERADARVPLRQIAPPSAFMLIAGEDGEAWCEAARRAAADRGIELVAVRVGHATGDWLDPRLAFVRLQAFGPEGAILVRPDRVIAWRSIGAVVDGERVVGAAFDKVLARTR